MLSCERVLLLVDKRTQVSHNKHPFLRTAQININFAEGDVLCFQLSLYSWSLRCKLKRKSSSYFGTFQERPNVLRLLSILVQFLNLRILQTLSEAVKEGVFLEVVVFNFKQLCK